jgi:hypothetical protein
VPCLHSPGAMLENIYRKRYSNFMDGNELGMEPRGKKIGLSTKKFDRCVTKVKRKGGAKNPYAICNASMGGKSKSNGKSKSRS